MIHPHRNNNNIGFNEAFALSGKPSVGNYYAMQDMTSDICSMVNIYDEPSQTQLIDKRDGKTYWVTKLKDGHCWMTENLDIDINSSIGFNSNNTDLNVAYDSSTGQYAEYSDGYTESNGVIYYAPASSSTTIDFQNTGPITGWQNSNTAPYTANKTDSTETGHNSLGNYYNWTAAIASNNSSSLTQDTLSDISKNPKNSICPKGWRLSTISSESETLPGSTNEFGRLNYLYNNNSITADDGLIIGPLWLTKSGCVESGNESCSGKGYYWSSTAGLFNITTPSAYMLGFGNGGVNPITIGYGGRYYGMPVRCVAR